MIDREQTSMVFERAATALISGPNKPELLPEYVRSLTFSVLDEAVRFGVIKPVDLDSKRVFVFPAGKWCVHGLAPNGEGDKVTWELSSVDSQLRVISDPLPSGRWRDASRDIARSLMELSTHA